MQAHLQQQPPFSPEMLLHQLARLSTSTSGHNTMLVASQVKPTHPQENAGPMLELLRSVEIYMQVQA